MPRLQTLRPGPARAKSATPAAGPGENLGGHSVGARPATAGCLRACAGQGCGPHGSNEPHDALTFLAKSLFRTLRRIPHSDCFTAPAAGYRYRETGELVGDGTGGHSWSASSLTTDHFQVGSLWFGSDYMGALNSTHRSHALSVRCVQASAQKLPFLRMHAPGPGVFPSSPETFSFSAQPSVRRMDRLSINRSKIC